jgi:hypothetical protein
LSGTEGGNRDAQAAFEKAQAVKRAHQGELMSKPNVVGVGVGLLKRGGVRSKTVGLVVMVRQKVPPSQLAPDERVPREIDGVPVDVQTVGEIRAQ